MQITIKYFGQIAEITNTNEEIINLEGETISELLELLYIKYDSLKHKEFQVAQNEELVSETTKATGKDIAILPPFAGG